MRGSRIKIPVWLLIAFSAVTVFTTAISTLAWFTLSAPPSASMVTGSSDVEIEGVTGYKIKETRKANGFVDYSSEHRNISEQDLTTNEFSTKENTNKQGYELDFDVPPDGIGYYVVVPNSLGTYKFIVEEKNYAKFSTYSSGSAMSAEIYVPADTAFRIRSYQMQNYETDLKTMHIDNDACNGAVIRDNKEVTPNQEGYYKVWIDPTSGSETTNCKVGVEWLSAAAPNLLPQSKINPKKLSVSGGETIWFKPNSNWTSNNAKMALYVFKDSNNSTVQMNEDGNTGYYSATVPSGDWSKLIFVRVDPSWSGGNVWDKKWNQTGDLNFSSDPYNCYEMAGNDTSGDWDKYGGSWTEHKAARIKVGNASYANMSWDSTENQWYYNLPGTVANNTALKFEKYGVADITITRTPDGASLPDINNLNINGSTYTIPRGGSGLVAYLHTDNSVWVTSVSEAKVSIGGGTAQTMSYENVDGGQWHYTANNVADNATLSFTFSGISITVSKSDDSSTAWYNKNNFNGTKILRGASSLDIYLHKDHTVWVSCVVEINSGTGDYVPMVDNPDNTGELMATGIDVTAGDTVTLRVNGSSVAYTAKSQDYNNISGTTIVKTAESVGMYLDKETKALWVEGNKTYALFVGGTNLGEMAYQSAQSIHPGWYASKGVSVTAGTVDITLNGVSIGTLSIATGEGIVDNNFNDSTKKIRKGGTVDVYLDTSNKAVHVTPIYSISIGGTNVVATLTNGSYQASFDSFADDATVKAFINDQEQTTYVAEGSRLDSRNNCYGSAGSLKTMNGVDAATIASFNKTNGTVWVDGYAPTYWVKIDDGNYVQMTQDANDDSQFYVDITASAGSQLYFRRNASNTDYTNSVAPKEPIHLNNINASRQIINAVENKRLYLNIDDNKAWIQGKEIEFKFYDVATSIYAYMWQYGDTSINNGTFPGALMHNDGNYVHSYTYTVGDNTLDRLIFSVGDSSRQTIDIDISSNDFVTNYAGKCLYFGGMNDSKYNVNAYDIGSLPTSSRIYVYDKALHFGGAPQAYTWGAGGDNTWPGIPMHEIIPGALWGTAVDSGSFANLIIANRMAGENNQTAQTTIANAANKVFVTTGLNNKEVTGTWASKNAAPTVNAKVYVGSDTTGTTMAIGNWKEGDLPDQGRNKYIYERGISATDGDTLTVKIDGTPVTKFVSGIENYPYLDVDDSTITVTLGEGESARFNFYINDKDELAIIMVPDRGNGFYIMPYVNSTVGFIGAHKMSSSNSTSALYDGYYAEKNTKIYLRSYIDAKDKLYSLAPGTDEKIAKVAKDEHDHDITGVIELQKSTYYTIEISDGVVVISEFTLDEFLKMNALDQHNRTVSNQTDIYNQLTSMVIAVKFRPTSSRFSMTPQIMVTNDATDYLGVAAAFVTEANAVDSPYLYMRESSQYNYDAETNPNGLKKRGANFTLGNTDFTTTVNGTGSYYAYILIDYVYSNALANIPYDYSANVNLFIRLAQVA